VQWHSWLGSPKYPQGHGFITAASMKRDGKVTEIAAARYSDRAIFQGLAHHLPHVALKFGQLVEKQYAVVA